MKKIISISLVIIFVAGGVLSAFAALFMAMMPALPFEANTSLTALSYEVPVVATVNNIPILLDEYKIYLRPHVLHFEEMAGPDIWQATIDGVPTTQIVKEQALESALLVVLTNSHTTHYLSQEYLDLARTQAYELFATFSPQEQQQLSLDAAERVRRAIILHNQVQLKLTQNYHEDARDLVFTEMFYEWRSTANLYINDDIWQSIQIGGL